MKRIKPLCIAALLIATIAASATEALARRGGQLVLTVVDKDTKRPISCRLHLYRGAKQRIQRIKGHPFWEDHIVIPGNVTLKLPNGEYYFEIERGLEYVTRKGHFTIETFADDVKTVDLRRFVDMSEHGWWSGDLDVRRPLDDMKLLMAADDLHVAMIVGKEKSKRRTSSRSRAKKKGDPTKDAGSEKMPVRFEKDRYYSTDAYQTVWPGTTLYSFNGLDFIDKKELGPDRSLTTKTLPLAHLKNSRKAAETWIDVTRPYWWDLPVLVAQGMVDSVEIAHPGFRRTSVVQNEKPGRPRSKLLYPGKKGIPRWTQDIYFKLIDAGFRIPPSAGSGSGDVPNPIGYNRMYVYVEGPMSYQKWWTAFRAGRVTVTNGPLLRPSVEGALPGDTFKAEEGKTLDLEIALTLSTRDPISYLEIVKNGKVEKTIPFADYVKNGKLPKLHFKKSGWFLIRAVNDTDKTYRFAMTAPYYVQIGYDRRVSRASVQFFIDWIDERIAQLEREKKKPEDLEIYHRAKKVWEELAKKANAE